MKKSYLVIGILILVIIFGIIYFSINKTKITNFEECVDAGNPVMESYPRQCRDPITDKTFTEEIKDYWRFDSIHLMQHETKDSYGCFGCSVPSSNKTPAMYRS